MKRIKKLFGGVAVLLAGVFLILIIATSVTGILVRNAKIPGMLGNSRENISFVEGNTDPNDFTFAVVGDPKCGTATFEALLDILRLDKPAFVILLGDFVSHYLLIEHKLFANEIAEHAEKTPIFLVPGNHDINEEEGFGLKDFRAIYGTEQFSFTIGKNLFICLNDIPPYANSGQYVNFAGQEIQKNLNKVKRIFVFMHIPIWLLDNPSICDKNMPGSNEFLELAKKYDIDYVFAGHHHAYVKAQRDNTTFIVSGGGGDRLRGIHGRFHHTVRIAVKNDSVTETVLGIEPRLETSELIERNIVVYLWPAMVQNIIPTSIISLLAICIIAGRFHKFLVKKQNGI